MNNRVITTNSYNPWHNLALEKLLFQTCGNENILYLWQNANTVVIGRNQNAWRECNIAAMEQDGITLARRESGGGAVFHDLGNLNFTFITPNKTHDVARQLHVIQDAVIQFGIKTELSGRNDLIISENGCKFSGNAFQRNDTHSLHHGTILIDADMEKVGRYLTPSAKKLEAKGVTSVKSRVCNLKAIAPLVTVYDISASVIMAFEREYGAAEYDILFEDDDPRLQDHEQALSSWDWRFGKTPTFNMTLENRFSWGEVVLLLNVQHGVISSVHVYSDSMNEELANQIVPLLSGCEMSSQAICEKLSTIDCYEASDLKKWISTERI